MPRGGFRHGAGRKKNSPNKATKERQARVAATGIAPLDYMLGVMRDETADLEVRLEAAKAAAPFVHPRLSTVEVDHIRPQRSLAEIDARLVELFTSAMRRRDRGQIVGIESKSPALIEGVCAATDEVGAPGSPKGKAKVGSA